MMGKSEIQASVTQLVGRCTAPLGALALLASVLVAAPQEVRGYELQFEGWSEDLRPLVASSTSLAPYAGHVEYDVLGFRLEYSTIFRGEEITVSGLIVVPLDVEDEAPILVWSHGTLFDERSAPSSWRHPLQIQLMPALSGMITFMPDYVGYGASAELIHPYILNDCLVSVIDMIHAGRQFLEEEGFPFSDELHLFGFSEGGYVALATAHELDTNAKHGLEVTQVNAISGPYDIFEAARLILSDESYPIPAYSALLLAAYNERYWHRPTTEFFQEPYADLMARFQSRKVGLGLLAGSMPSTIGQLMSPAFTSRFEGDGEVEVKAALKANAVPPWAPSMPVFLYHGTADRDVPLSVGEKQHKAMLAAGADARRLSFTVYEGAGHSATVFKAVRSFFERQQ